MKQYGLIGKVLGHSFSKKYFTEKFANDGTDAKYDLYELAEIEEFERLVRETELCGLNVTIPYKQDVMRYLDGLDPTAEGIGAVNTIKFVREAGKTRLVGYNTDVIGFGGSIEPLIKGWHKKALVLGTGGASKAVVYALGRMGIEWKYVSRKGGDGMLSYDALTAEVMDEYKVIVNCSPVGMHPNVDDAPRIPYERLTKEHLLYDLVYNPDPTKFMTLGAERGAVVKSGLEMLIGQAEAAWKIWNS